MPSKNASENLTSVMPPPYPGEYPKIVVPPPGPKAKAWNARDREVVSQNLTPDYELVTERVAILDIRQGCGQDAPRQLDLHHVYPVHPVHHAVHPVHRALSVSTPRMPQRSGIGPGPGR